MEMRVKIRKKFHFHISFFQGKMPKGSWRLGNRRLSKKPNKKNEIRNKNKEKSAKQEINFVGILFHK